MGVHQQCGRLHSHIIGVTLRPIVRHLHTNPSTSTSPTKCVASFVASVAGQLSKPVESVPGFQMHSEDFPALPGTATKASGKLSCTPYDVFTLTELRLLYIFRKC